MIFPASGDEQFRNYNEWTAIPSGWLSKRTDTSISEATPSGRPFQVDDFPRNTGTYLKGPGKGGWVGWVSDPTRTKNVERLWNLYIKSANCDTKKRP